MAKNKKKYTLVEITLGSKGLNSSKLFDTVRLKLGNCTRAYTKNTFKNPITIKVKIESDFKLESDQCCLYRHLFQELLGVDVEVIAEVISHKEYMKTSFKHNKDEKTFDISDCIKLLKKTKAKVKKYDIKGLSYEKFSEDVKSLIGDFNLIKKHKKASKEDTTNFLYYKLVKRSDKIKFTRIVLGKIK